MKILIISPRFPYPIEKGDKLRLYHQIRHLSSNYEIYLISLTDTKVDKDHIEHIREFVQEVHVFRLKKIAIYINIVLRFFSGLPLQVLYFYNKRINSKIGTIIEDVKPSIIYNQLIRTTEYTKHISCYKVLDYMDAFSTGMHNRLDNSRIPFKWIYKLERNRLLSYENRIFKHFDAHTIISEQDKTRLASHIEGDIEIVPNGVDTDYFHPEKQKKKYDICFVGNMGYRPNVVAAEYLCLGILPGLLKQFPDLKVVLAGIRPDARVKRLENDHVVVTGWMKDIRKAYNESRIFVAPIFTGIGQQNKVLEAMSMALPCVCTSSVNHPIGSRVGAEVLLADDKQAFVDQISKLLNNPELGLKIGEQSRSFVVNQYGWQKQVDKLINIFEKKA